MAIAPLPPGAELCPEYGSSQGRFVVRRCLAQGPLVFAYEAEDRLRGGRRVVVSECAPGSLAGRPEGAELVSVDPAQQGVFADALRRFERQAQLLLELQHPGVERVFDRFAQNGTLYHAGRFYPGARALRGAFGERPGWPQVEPLAQRLLDALAACHDVGLVHGDLGPDTVLLEAEGGEARLVRFGAGGQAETPGSDLHAWGLLMHGLLVGDDAPQDAARALAGRGVPAEWAEVIAQCLRPHPAERPADVAALRASLAVFAELGASLDDEPPEPEGPAAAEPRKIECTSALDAIEQIEALGEPVALGFSANADELRELLEHEAAKRIVSLSLRAKYGAPLNLDGVRSLAEGPAPRNLSSLGLKLNDFGAEEVRALARSSLFKRLSSLGLRCNEPGDEGVKALTGALPANLTSLDLWLKLLSDEAARVLAGCAGLANLTSLTLCSELLTDEGVRALASSPSLSRVRSLDLSCNSGLTDAVARMLAARPSSRRLTSLNLGYTELSDETAAALARSPHLGRLASLRLDYTPITDEGAMALVRSATLAGLRELHLQMCSISDAGRSALEAEKRPGLALVFLAISWGRG